MRARGATLDLAALPHWAHVEVRYSDLDVQGHVNNAVFFTYFEQGRVSFFAELRRLAPRESSLDDPARDGGEATTLSPQDITFVIVEASCAYKRPVAGLAPVYVGVGVAQTRHAAMEMAYAVCDRPRGTVYATGTTLMASVDLATGRPKALPAWSREALARLSSSSANAAGTSGPSA